MYSMTPQEFRTALNERGIFTQIPAGEALGVTQRTISRWLNGVSPVPKLAEMALKTIPKVPPKARRKST